MALRPLQIGRVRLATNLLLAPIAGYCDLAFRLVVRSCGGVGLACTDLLSPEGVLRATPHSMSLAQTDVGDSPLCMQLYGSNRDRLCEAALWAVDHGADIVDLNMGCPVDKITKKDGGSKLLCDPDNTLRMVEKIAATLARVGVPFTCKLRLGWDDSYIVAPYLAPRLEALGVAAITIHGRTTEMRFSGEARLDGIAQVVASVRRIPVIGNGDVRTPADARRMFERTGCHGIMIGRGALARPWVFREIQADLTGDPAPPEPTLAEKLQIMRDHFWNMVRYRNEHAAVVEFRKRVSWYAKSMHPCAMLKDEMRLLQTKEQFEDILTRFAEWRRERDGQFAGEVVEVGA